MYYVKKTMEVSAAHNLFLNYESKCKNLHGHNYIITVYCKAKQLNSVGMVIDFSHIKDIVNGFDHAYINDIEPFNVINPTAENMAQYICEHIKNCYRVDVEETKGNVATYIDEEMYNNESCGNI